MNSEVLTAVAAALSAGPQPVLPGFLNSLAGPLAHYGLWAILLLVLVEDFGIPLPGETVLIAGAIFAGSGQLNVFAVALTGFAAAVIGDNIGYTIGRFGGRILVERWGRYIFLTPERLKTTEAFFESHGAKIITIARFIEGLRQANGIIAGIAQMHWLRFLIFNALGAALWVGAWVSIGYFAGQHITPIYGAVTRYSLYAAIAAVVLIAAWIAYHLRKRRRSRAAAAPSSAEPAAADAPAAAADVDDSTGHVSDSAANDSDSATEVSDSAARVSDANGQGPHSTTPVPGAHADGPDSAARVPGANGQGPHSTTPVPDGPDSAAHVPGAADVPDAAADKRPGTTDKA
jgi:membrane protein DedA with SNARE-associated domain